MKLVDRIYPGCEYVNSLQRKSVLGTLDGDLVHLPQIVTKEKSHTRICI